MRSRLGSIQSELAQCTGELAQCEGWTGSMSRELAQCACELAQWAGWTGSMRMWTYSMRRWTDSMRRSLFCVESSFKSRQNKITIRNRSHKSYRKYKSENGRTRTSEYIRGGIRCHGGVSIPCWPVTPAVSPISTFDKRYDP
jgi:hypothetical protein